MFLVKLLEICRIKENKLSVSFFSFIGVSEIRSGLSNSFRFNCLDTSSFKKIAPASMTKAMKNQVLKRCAVAQDRNGISKAMLFENLTSNLSAPQREQLLQELVDEGELLKVRRDRYIINEMVRKEVLSVQVDLSLAYHVANFKANHIILLVDI